MYIPPFFYKEPIHHKHVVLFFLLLVAIFLTIVIAGGSSHISKGLYILQLDYTPLDSYTAWTGLANTPLANAKGIVNDNALSALDEYIKNSSTVVRFGYFGVCALTNVSTTSSHKTGSWVCGRNVTAIASQLTQADDPLNILYVANKLRTSAFSPWVLIVSLCVAIGIFVLLHLISAIETVIFTSACAIITLGFTLAVTGMAWQQSAAKAASVAIDALSQTTVTAKVGSSLSGLGWSAVVLLSFCTAILVHMYIRGRRNEFESAEPPIHIVPPPGFARYPSATPMDEVEGLVERAIEKDVADKLH